MQRKNRTINTLTFKRSILYTKFSAKFLFEKKNAFLFHALNKNETIINAGY